MKRKTIMTTEKHKRRKTKQNASTEAHNKYINNEENERQTQTQIRK